MAPIDQRGEHGEDQLTPEPIDDFGEGGGGGPGELGQIHQHDQPHSAHDDPANPTAAVVPRCVSWSVLPRPPSPWPELLAEAPWAQS